MQGVRNPAVQYPSYHDLLTLYTYTSDVASPVSGRTLTTPPDSIEWARHRRYYVLN